MARFDRGWIKVHREVVEEDIGQRGNFTLGLFVRLLRMAHWKEGSRELGGQRLILKPGQLATGLRELSPDRSEDPHLHRVRNALAYLEKRGTITQAASNQGRIITLCNWDEYQGPENESASVNASEAQADRKRSASEAQHSKEGKKGRKKEEGYSPEFEAAWEAFGKVGKKRDASKAFAENVEAEKYSDLLKAIASYLADCRAKERTQMYFGTFLREDWTIWIERRQGSLPFREKSLEEVLRGA